MLFKNVFRICAIFNVSNKKIHIKIIRDLDHEVLILL